MAELHVEADWAAKEVRRIDVDEVIANVTQSYTHRRQHWDDKPVWPNATVAALAQEILALRLTVKHMREVGDLIASELHLRDPLVKRWLNVARDPAESAPQAETGDGNG